MTTLFERLSRERPSPPIKKAQETSPAQKLLDWLQTWRKPTVRSADILIYGPTCTRTQKDADSAIEVLVRNGWLEPTKTKQSNWRRWQIIHKPTVYPKLAD